MPPDQYIPLISAIIAFAGLVLVVLQLRDNAKQQTVNSLVGILDTNRKLISMGFSHTGLFGVLRDEKTVAPEWERYYLQLWLNQFSLLHTYFKNAIFRGEQKENLERELASFLAMKNMQHHWREYGAFYPDSFQKYVNDILKKIEPPKTAAHARAE
jgi:hypothetical protein